MHKAFKIAEVSAGPVSGHDVYGFLLLARDGELWKVGRRMPDYLPPEWRVGQIIDVRMRYSGPDELKPDWQFVGCDHWEPMKANNPRAAVAKLFGSDVADRFVPLDDRSDG